MLRSSCFVALLVALACLPLAAAEPTPSQLAFFESRVRPLLAEHCFSCHGPEKQKSGLRLDSRQSVLKGGETGPAIRVDKPDASLLLEAINYRGLEMPPSGKLDKQQIDLLTRWVKMGAPWPEGRALRTVDDDEFTITEEDRDYWAFRPLQRPNVPRVGDAKWSVNPIDAFILARLRASKLHPNPPADRRQLVRRVYFDLVGLPPTPMEVKRFLADTSPQALERLIDELLSRDQFGERWGRHWLDVVRFGQTNGYERDDEKPEAWRFRDYVIKSFNEDKPFNQFVREHLAGDELNDVSHESIIATGYYRIGVWDDEPAEKELALYDELDDIVRTTGSAFLGLTIGCARCHQHMFDPISQRDYYEFLAFFRNVAPYGRDKGGNSETHWETDASSVFTPLITSVQLAEEKARREEVRAKVAELKNRLGELAAETQKEQRAKLEAEIKKLNESLKPPNYPRALSVRERGPKPPPTHLFLRGDPKAKSDVVQPNVLAVFHKHPEKKTPLTFDKPEDSLLRQTLLDSGVQPTSGRRRAAAEWIAGDRNPLTPRVFVNRIWQHLFGRGIVPTTNNFGKAVAPPTHPQLLDWLARDFVDGGWKVKPIIKKIMLSRAYQMSSRASNEQALAADPGNNLFWRHNLRRLEAEAVRDSILAVSGRLNLKMGGRGFFPHLSADVLATQSRPGSQWDKSPPEERTRRSVYIFVKRTLMVPMLEAFDYTNTAEPLGVRPVTTVAPQALMLLNDQFVEEQAAAFADRVRGEAGDDVPAQVKRAFQLALARLPTNRELSIGVRLTENRPQGANGLRSLCLTILNLNEFVYVD